MHSNKILYNIIKKLITIKDKLNNEQSNIICNYINNIIIQSNNIRMNKYNIELDLRNLYAFIQKI